MSLIAPLGTLAVVLVGFLYNNSRLSDFGGRLSDLKDFVRSEVARIDQKVEAKLETIRVEMARNHSEMLHRFAEIHASCALRTICG